MQLKSSGSDHLAHSFTDLMTSLMVIFVLLLLVFLNRQASTNSTVAQSIAKDLQQQLQKAGFEAPKILPNDPYTVVFQAPKDALSFARNKSQLGQEGKTFLKNEIPNLASILCDDKYRASVESLVVEGYPDGVPRRGVSTDNARNFDLKLGQERSREVVRHSLLSLDDRQRRGCLAEKISASGRGTRDQTPSSVTFKVRLNSAAALEELYRLAKERTPAAPADVESKSGMVALFDSLENNLGQFEFQLSEDQLNQYLTHTLARTPRPGVSSATVKLFAHNYISVYAVLDFDTIERERPGTIPLMLQTVLRGKQPVLLDFRLHVQDGKATYSVEKAYYRETELPLWAVRQLIGALGTLQPEHFLTEEPMPLPLGLRYLETRDHLLLWHK